MNGSSVFLDTNLLVYAYDRSEPVKQQRAIDVVTELTSIGTGSISAQVLGELFVVLTKEMKAALSVAEGLKRVEQHTQMWRVLDITTFIVLEAVRGVRRHRMSYWDAQIWATARMNHIPVVLSEDFSDGSFVEGIRFVNPVSPQFKISDWI